MIHEENSLPLVLIARRLEFEQNPGEGARGRRFQSSLRDAWCRLCSNMIGLFSPSDKVSEAGGLASTTSRKILVYCVHGGAFWYGKPEGPPTALAAWIQ